MATRFQALEELHDDALELPVKGKTYRIPSPSADDGLRVQRITTMAAQVVAGGEALDTEALDDDEERNLLQLCLGPVWDELRVDGVDWAWVKHVGVTAMLWITAGVEASEKYWAAAGDPTQLAGPNREARRKQAKKSGSASGKSTRKPASTSGTSGPKASGKSQRAAKT